MNGWTVGSKPEGPARRGPGRPVPSVSAPAPSAEERSRWRQALQGGTRDPGPFLKQLYEAVAGTARAGARPGTTTRDSPDLSEPVPSAV